MKVVMKVAITIAIGKGNDTEVLLTAVVVAVAAIVLIVLAEKKPMMLMAVMNCGYLKRKQR